ncbi:MAG: metallophosphoesterase [Paracoccaceae bacterium]|nr:metallophosphoesterase [Paracoccaceae bacterium]
MVKLADAQAPEGMRLYAIGDVHGCPDLLAEVHRRITRDVEARPAEDWRVIHIGDYIDRGPDSAGALARLIDYSRDPKAVFLIGNHDQFLRDFLRDPDREDFELWMLNGGIETLDSFGLDGVRMMRECREAYMIDFRDRILEATPPGTEAFLARLALWEAQGDYAFVHAGIMPGYPLDEQSDHDLLWIRELFLESNLDHGAVIVHGHTPTDTVELHPNRIAIDTGAVFTGVLSCLVLEDDRQSLLGPDGPDAIIGRD